MDSETVRTIISAIVGAIITGVFGVWLQRTKNISSNEGIYADHTKELFDQMKDISNERDDLKEQVFELKGQVEKLNGVIDSLNEQIGNLTTKLEEFTRDGKEEK